MPSQRGKRHVAIWGTSVACLLIGASAALAQDKTFDLKLSHWVPPSHPLQKAMEEWGASVEKASNGTIKFKIYPSQQLGKAFDHYDMARDGITDFAYVNPGYQPGRFPVIAAGELPFLIADANGATRLPARPHPGDGRGRAALPHRRRQGRHGGARRVVPALRRARDEGRQGLRRL